MALRLPAFLAVRHLSFDDGVYGASAMAMRTGALPFREVFSSQGPLFLPLVWLFDLLGLRTLDAPRLLAVASGLALVAGHLVGRPGPAPVTGAAAVAAGLVATSGSVLWVTGPLTSDGPGLALAAWAVTAALWYRRAPSLRLALLTGALLGAALSVKSLLLGAVVPVGWALLPGANRRRTSAGRRSPVVAPGRVAVRAEAGSPSARRSALPAPSAWRSPSPGASATSGTRPSATTSKPRAPALPSATSARWSRRSGTGTSPSSSPSSPQPSPSAVCHTPTRPTPPTRPSIEPERFAHRYGG